MVARRQHELVSGLQRELEEFRRRVVRADSMRDFEKLDGDLRRFIDKISNTIEDVADAPVTISTLPKNPPQGKRWLDDLYEEVVDVEEVEMWEGSKEKEKKLKTMLGREDYTRPPQRRKPVKPDRRNVKMNRSIKGKAAKVLMQELEKIKNDAYDSLFDVSETIERMKRRS